MSISRLVRKLHALFRRDEVEQQLDDELRFHLDREIEENLASGMTHEQARLAAMRSFGNVDQSKEECRDARGVTLIEDLMRDVRYSVRLLIKNPTFTLIAVLTLALGIGANTAIFSLLDAVLLKSLPVKEPDRLVLYQDLVADGIEIPVPGFYGDVFLVPKGQTARLLGEGHGFGWSSGVGQVEAVGAQRGGVVRSERERSRVMPVDFLPIPVIVRSDRRQRSVSLNERLVKGEGFQRCLAAQRVRLANRHQAVAAEQGVGVRQAAVRPRVRGIEIDGFLKVVPGFVEPVDGVLGPVKAAPEIVLIGG